MISMLMQTKTDKAVALLQSGALINALRIFKTFRIGFTKEERRTLQIAYECQTGNELFYQSIGIDTKAEIEKSKRIVELKYLK